MLPLPAVGRSGQHELGAGLASRTIADEVSRTTPGSGIMAAKITRDVLESYLNCKYKGYLKLTGQQGTKHDYETLLTETRALVRLAALDKILASHPEDEIPRNVPLTVSALKQGAPFL